MWHGNINEGRHMINVQRADLWPPGAIAQMHWKPQSLHANISDKLRQADPGLICEGLCQPRERMSTALE